MKLIAEEAVRRTPVAWREESLGDVFQPKLSRAHRDLFSRLWPVPWVDPLNQPPRGLVVLLWRAPVTRTTSVLFVISAPSSSNSRTMRNSTAIESAPRTRPRCGVQHIPGCIHARLQLLQETRVEIDVLLTHIRRCSHQVRVVAPGADAALAPSPSVPLRARSSGGSRSS